MDALFALEDGASAEDVRQRLTDPPGYSAVRAMLVRLEAKGYVRHREEGLRYVYVPIKSRASAQRTALDKLVHVFLDVETNLKEKWELLIHDVVGPYLHLGFKDFSSCSKNEP